MRTRRDRPGKTAEPLPRKPDAEVLAKFTPEKQEEFFHGGGDMGNAYFLNGFIHFYADMRGALLGNPENLATIFTKYRSFDTEGYSPYIEILISQLGDRYFAHQLAKQPVKIRRKITKCLWEVAWRTNTPVTPDAAGEVPAADNGKFYPHTGRILLELQSAGAD